MTKKRVTVETLWKLERPVQPTLSPDGAQACVSVSSYDMQENSKPVVTIGAKSFEMFIRGNYAWVANAAEEKTPGSRKLIHRGDLERQNGGVFKPNVGTTSGKDSDSRISGVRPRVFSEALATKPLTSNIPPNLSRPGMTKGCQIQAPRP